GKVTSERGVVGRVRESDALELTLRLGAMWQRLAVHPLRQTQQVTLYKKDLERVEEVPVLSGPISDVLEPLPGPLPFWRALACRVGLVRRDDSGECLEAASPEFWIDNAVHLPQMIATGWLGLRTWSEWEPAQGERLEGDLPLSFLRPVLLLWLSSLGDEEWVGLDGLSEHLRSQYPGWDQPAVRAAADGAS